MTSLINTIEQTMSSREIARLTGKKHQHVMRDIREIASQLTENHRLSKFGQSDYTFKQQSYINQQGKEMPEYQLNQKEVLLLVSGYNVVLRAAVINRWIELEKQQGVIKMPRSLNVYGKEALPYVEWLLINGYSVTSGQYHRRIKKHPEQFYKTAEGKWYINREFAEQLLKVRDGYKALSQVQGLPQIKQVTIFDVIN
ncbi:Rha family transcriptional regulator [Capnocytophaga sp. H2931]|uniref:Rha family transcriptional regulator n=1 Tax=Capnocytophaga sp. H2931 TaxID=1945657 RepID=UPI000BB1AB13|nr:Rha family transcriptional regulator [Capnocytophaga sp. H2931]ATA75258.1 hypothetical protein CGC52_07425 [Capnocytophaga sp. H2931]